MKNHSFIVLTVFALATTVPSDAFSDEALSGKSFAKCGTPFIVKQMAEHGSLEKTAYQGYDRQEMDAFADSREGHFRVHYNTSGNDAPSLVDMDLNGIPDYIDSTLVFLEIAWQTIVVDLGYGTPRSDGTRGGGQDITDCYIMELSRNSLYGLTTPDIGIGTMSSSYLSIDNNFTDHIYPTKGYSALKITTAHEFFHVIHFSYYGAEEALWWMEHSAVWMENRIWGDVDDYFNYLGYYFENMDLPLDTINGSFEYGAALFAMYLAERHGDSIIRTVWTRFRDSRDGTIETLNAVVPGGVGTALSEMASWLYFTGVRANPDKYFMDSAKIANMIVPEHVLSEPAAFDSLSMRHYTFSYIDIAAANGFSPGDSLTFQFKDYDNGLWINSILFYTSPTNAETVIIPSGTGVINVTRPFDHAIVIVTNATQGINRKYRYTLNLDFADSQGVEDNPAPEQTVLLQNTPNPFNNTTMIPFILSGNSHVSLEIFDIRGVRVSRLIDGVLDAGRHQALFDARDLSSGSYFAVLTAGNTRTTSKLLFLK